MPVMIRRFTHLISFHFQLAFFVKLRVPETDAAELQVVGENFLVVLCEARRILFVDHLKTIE